MSRFGLGLLALGFLAALGAPSALAGPILMEVLYDGVGSDGDEAFTEIYGTPGLSLTGWSLVGINGVDNQTYRTISLTGMTIPSDGLLVLATSVATGAALAARDYVASVDWQNGPDAIWLLDAAGLIADALQYGDAGGYNAGESNYAPDVPPGYSLSRDAFGTDTNNNAADFTVLSSPTPGVGPTAPVPEPATLVLLGGGLSALLGARRRRRAVAARPAPGPRGPFKG